MAWTDTIFQFIGLARYNTVKPALTNGQTCEPQCDENGRLLVNTIGVVTTWSDSGAVVAEKQIKSASGRIYQVFGRNTGVSTKYFFVFNATARPTNGSTAELFVPVKVAAGEAFSITIERSRAFTTGLYWGISSTDATFTYDSGGLFAVSVEYE